MATVEEVEILISKLLSDKAKLREDGIKELSSYLDATGGVSLCPLLDRQTALFNQLDKLRSSTWPGVVRAVCQCNKIECSTSKKRVPKPIFSRVLRSVIQKAEDRIRVGTLLFLPQDIKSLFSHLLEAIVEAPSFIADYSQIIRQLVIISDFCAQISRPVYAKLVGFFLERVKVLVLENMGDTVSTKEEAFRAASTLHCLLQNAPEDFVEKVREPLIEGLSDVFLHLRDEGRVARKLLASLNIFLLKDGVNLGDLLIDVHSSIKGFISRTWKVTRDRELKDELVFYGRLQLKFKTVVVFSEGDFIFQMQPLVEKDLDQGCAISFAAGSYRFDGGREGKLWTITKGMWHFLDFAASILMEAHRCGDSRSLAPPKKQRKDNVFATLTEHLIKGNSLWWGSFCLLVRYHHQHISRLIQFEWLKCLSGHLEKAFTDASSSTASFEALVWILRCLQEVAAVSPFVSSAKAEQTLLPHLDMQCKSFWEFVWVTVLHWLPLFSSTSIIVDESLKLLGYLLVQSLLSVYVVPQDFWVLKPFSETPSGNVLFFIASFFSSAAEQVAVREDIELWKKLLNCTVSSVDKQEHLQLKTAAILALTVGCVPDSLQPFLRQRSASPSVDDLQDWAKLEDCCQIEEADFKALDEFEPFLVNDEPQEISQGSAIIENNLVSLPIKQAFVKELADILVKKTFLLTEGNKQGTLEQLFTFSAIVISCFDGVVHALQGRGQEMQEWSYDGQVYQGLLRILNSCICRVEESIRGHPNLSIKEGLPSLHQSISDIFLPETNKSLKGLLSSERCTTVSGVDYLGHLMTFSSLLENLLLMILRLMQSTNEFLNTVMEAQSDSTELSPSSFHAANASQEAVDTSILDVDFDDVKKSTVSNFGGSGEAINLIGSGASLNLKQQWRFSCVNTIAAFAQQLPERTCDIFLDLLRAEEDPKIKREILLCLCKSITYSRSNQVPYVVDYIEAQKDSMGCFEASPYYVLTAVDTLLTTLLSSTKSYIDCSLADLEVIRTKWSLPQKMFIQLAKLLDDVSQNTFLFWRFRERMAEAIAKLLVLDPTTTDALLDKFMSYLHDVDYRVRCIMSTKVKVLFQAYTGHEGLFKDICTAFGTKLVMATKEKIISASEVSLTSKNRCIAETAVMTLGEVAACSDKVEIEAVFMICANAAILPSLRLLSCAVLDRLARQLHYPNRWKYLSHLLFCIFSFWVKIGLPLPTLVEIRVLLVCNSEPIDFLKYCCPMLIPSLLLYSRDNELTWLAKVISKPIATLVKESSAEIFSSLLPLYCHGDEQEKELARSVLQGKMLVIANLSEDDRDLLIRKNMVSIVNGLFQLCSVADSPQFPFHRKRAIISSVKTVVDGFCGSESCTSQTEKQNRAGIKDVLKIFRADRVFMFILQIHLQIEASYNSRHRRDKLAGLECIIDVIQANVKVPNTCRYLFHTILQSLEIDELQEKCCNILRTILNILLSLPGEECSEVLGPHLQLVVWYLVSACMKLHKRDNEGSAIDSPVFALLKQVTVRAAPALHQYIKELPPFPDLPMFRSMQEFRSKLCASSNKAYDLSKFVMQTTELPPLQRLKSLQNLHKAFSSANDDGCSQLQSDSQAALVLLRSVRQCFDSNSNDLVDVAGDIIAKMGIGDPHAVAFSLPCHYGTAEFSSAFSWGGAECAGTDMSSGVSDDLLRAILVQLKSYLIDEHALVIELTAQTLKGLLSTEKGYRVLKNMEPKDSTYLSVFSRGFNQRIVEDALNTMKTESIKKSIPLENDVLWDISGKAYDDWVCLLVYSLSHYCEDTILRLCQGVVHCKSFLAESLLPHILGSLAASSGVNSNICKLISCQVEKHIFSEKNHNTRSIQLFLNALNELRRCDILARMKLGQEYAKKQEKSKVYWLHLDYLKTASVAQKCGAYFTSALYVEHWCEETFGKLGLGEPDFSDEEELPVHMELLLTICTRINEPDGVYGVVRSHKLLPQVLLYEHEGDWSRAVGSYDLLLRNKDVMRPRSEVFLNGRVVEGPTTGNMVLTRNSKTEWNYNKGLMKSLQRTGCDHVLKMYCKGLALEQGSIEQDIEFQELQYESAWRTGKWDFYYASPKTENGFNSPFECPRSVNFHSNLFWCLRSLLEGDAAQFCCRIKCAKQKLVKLISLTSLESTGNVFPTIIRLQILDSLNEAWSLRWKADSVKRGKLLGPFIPSTQQLEIMDNDLRQRLSHMQYQFDLFEPFVAFRTILLKVLDCESRVPQQLLEFATVARKAGRVNQAAAAIYELKQHYKRNNSSTENAENVGMSAARKVQEAKILWAQGQQEMAVSLLKYVISHHNVQDNSGSVYCLTGKWLAETRSDSARIILKHYLQRAVQLLENAENKNLFKLVEKRSRAYYRMAHYADSLYKSYEERLNSSEWQAALRLRNHKSKEAEVLARRIKQQAEQRESVKKGSGAARFQDGRLDLTRKYLELQKQLAMDNEEAQRLETDKEAFMLIALNSYRQCLTTSDKYDLRVVFRITSLWFNLSTNQGVVKSMLDTINQVKSYKFLPLVYQIASRLGPLKEAQGVPSFQHVLTCLVKKLATEHPYHTVNQLLALANGDRVKDKQRSKTAFVVDVDKKQAAEVLLSALALDKKDLIQQMKQLVEIYIRLAEIEVKKDDMGKRLPLPRDIRSIRQLELVPVITAEIPIAPNAEYSEGYFPYYKGLSDRFLVMYGVNAPKVVECYGSDGRQYRQLAKSGDDDLRQDAVMEQLFSLVNLLLQHHPDTRKRRLGIRTYKVVPFTPSAGVLEWVNGTMPLGEYLMGSDRKGGAHACYGLGDWTFPACREHLEKEEDKHKAFQKVCQNFRPVFHNFFLEKFAHPAEWFKKRLAYTRSVAASSMVGYIVGLGDRHSMNILLDQESAEVVHIDLGVAFEQGKMLKMPERVPFRLTRDIVDGMGVTGVEGVFRRCCEETLSVMRTNKDALLTIIEVFIHDPLYKWALSPLKALQRQQDTIDIDEFKEDIADLESSGENKDAARALMRVKQKLDGYEGGDMRSIQGQVQQLIQDAQDSERLCQMFSGWAAWL